MVDFVPRRFLPLIAIVILAAAMSDSAAAAPRPSTPPSFATKTKSAVRREGLLTTWLDAKAGKLFLELPAPSGPRSECGRFLYLEGIRTGLGSNPVGLDRGQWGETRVVAFRRIGGRVLLEQPNLRYRAQSKDSLEVRAVQESFAASILWGAEIAAEAPDGRLLVDFTQFLMRDAHGIAATLKRTEQGSFSLDKDRSALDTDQCPSFPDNLEFESVLTFTGNEPGREVRATAPTPQAITIVQHQSLVRLPDDGYRPRVWDPRSGSFEVIFADYSQPIASDLEVRWVVRHRLEKVDPAAARSRVKKPIVYYVDSGAPEPIRSALVDGVSWWAKAFEAAGFIDAFQVRLLPAGVSPQDVRYNVIQWVHRATRGWSYGGGVIDPRTGEMIQGRVVLGSLRIRQDRLIFEGLAGAEKTGTGADDDPVVLSLARIRQLAAHEVGHTLGFNHNFAASTYGGRASVMDYPAPLIAVRPNGTLDFSHAYAAGAGAWDVRQVLYAYAQFAPGADERAGLEAILRENVTLGHRYLSDPDTRPAGAAHPLSAMWDNGADPIAGLDQAMTVRRIALSRFGERNLPHGAPLGGLAEVLAPLYFHHRYQLETAAKSIGGVDYAYAVKGEPHSTAVPVPPARQRAAIDAVLRTIEPEALDLSDSLIARLLPPSVEYPPRRELLDSRTGAVFDALGAAGTAADMTLATLLPPERMARMVDLHRRDSSFPGVEELLSAIEKKVFTGPAPRTARLQEIRRTIQAVAVRRLIMAASDARQTPAVRAALEQELGRLAQSLGRSGAVGATLSRDIQRFLSRPAGASIAAAPLNAPPDPPPGPPIGGWGDADECEWSGSLPSRP